MLNTYPEKHSSSLSSRHRNLNRTIRKHALFYHIVYFFITTYEVANFYVPINDKTHLGKILVKLEKHSLLVSEQFEFREKLRSV